MNTIVFNEMAAPRKATTADSEAEILPILVEVPAGEFIMGANDHDRFANDTERPPHRVGIAAFLLGRFAVSVGEFRRFRPDHAPGEAADWPAVGVNWHDAQAYCAWSSERGGRRIRLPSEAEWEYACRAGSRSAFASGDDLDVEAANFLHDESGVRVGPGGRTSAGRFSPNAFGLCDLHGNVNEWVEDTWHPDYHGAPADGRAWIDALDTRRVIRGGAWDYLPRLLRSAWRDWRPADQRTDNIGFRVASDAGKGAR